MNMPGFSAEGALYKSSRYYVGRTTSGALAASLGITPQLPIGFCMAECDGQYDSGSLDNQICKFGCMDTGGGGGGGDGGGGGGGGGSGRACLLCRRGCRGKVGATRTACLDACNDAVC